MKLLTITLLLAGHFAFAHDEGHGPKLGDQPKFGGKVVAVINKDEVSKGTKATMLYKAELTKTNQNVVRVYLYDKEMKPMKVEEFGAAKGELQFKDRKTKKWSGHEFKFEKKDGFYEGKLPTEPRKPFNVDVTLKQMEKNLFMAFDGLN
ncbi:MAG: hypothetical protein KDD35_09515 [Bdellovibrionales bacterium]|nr:hypothetical protein [Bdellovibrionales bacterium]